MPDKMIINAATGQQTTRPLTPAEQVDVDALQAANAALQQQETTRLTDRNAARALVLQTAASAEGIRFDALTTAQLRALLAILLWREGALDAAGLVRKLTDWVRPPEQ